MCACLCRYVPSSATLKAPSEDSGPPMLVIQADSQGNVCYSPRKLTDEERQVGTSAAGWIGTLMFDTVFIYWQNMGAIALTDFFFFVLTQERVLEIQSLFKLLTTN